MKNALLFVCAAALLAATAQAAIIEQYEAEFQSWAGQDADAHSPVTSSTGDTPASDFSMIWIGAAQGTGWLTQGMIGLSPHKYGKSPESGRRCRADCRAQRHLSPFTPKEATGPGPLLVRQTNRPLGPHEPRPGQPPCREARTRPALHIGLCFYRLYQSNNGTRPALCGRC